MHTVTSYGIALMRKNNSKERYEFLFIKKRITYAFITFVKGIYHKNIDNDVVHLFNNMTIEEKICIMSLNFSNIWYMSYLTSPRYMTSKEISKYENCKAKFEKRFLSDNGTRLKRLIQKSKSVDNVWEMPKGMKNKNESDINTAIREFSEETGIKKNKYKILWEEARFEYVFTDENVEYKYVYYPAIMLDQKYQPSIDIHTTVKSNLMESSDIKFLSVEDICLIHSKSHSLVSLLKRIKKKIRKYI
jgi:ADP-ribose pyrophosphatase YjhB (NUDIX family)